MMKSYLLAAVACLVLSGCVTSNTLTPEQLDAMARLSEIQRVSYCGRFGLEGSGGFVAGEGGFVICGGTEQPLTIDQANQFMNGISIAVPARP